MMAFGIAAGFLSSTSSSSSSSSGHVYLGAAALVDLGGILATPNVGQGISSTDGILATPNVGSGNTTSTDGSGLGIRVGIYLTF